jgi:hypothetical protein
MVERIAKQGRWAGKKFRVTLFSQDAKWSNPNKKACFNHFKTGNRSKWLVKVFIKLLGKMKIFMK